MRTKSTTMSSLKIALSASTVLVFCFARAGSAAPAQPEQKGFDTHQLAAEALIQAAETFDVAALTSILGPGSEALVASEDAVQDKNRAIAFAAKAHEKHSTVVEPKNPDFAVFYVGNEEWPLPIPIVKRNGKWYFDAKTGRDEILLRRIGANELDVI